jgi:hypothetical protein
MNGPLPNTSSSNLEPWACNPLWRLWETPTNFARKSVQLDLVPLSTFINRHHCRQTWITPLFKLITALILPRTLPRVLNCCKILVVIYWTYLITANQGRIVVLLSLRVMAILILINIIYYKQALIMTLYGNAALLLLYSFGIGIISE